MTTPAKTRAPLGVELTATEIRAVELRPHGTGVSIATVATYTPPPGYLTAEGIEDAAAVGTGLREALSAAGFGATEAVFGLPPYTYAFRTLNLPPVEDSELFEIVRGEVDAARLFGTETGSFDLVPLHDGRLHELTGRNVLLAAASTGLLKSLAELAQAAGLQVAAIEPSHTALARAAYVQEPTPAGLLVTMDAGYAEIWLLDGGLLALHRAFELEGLLHEEDLGDANTSLALELHRSAEYAARQLPDRAPDEAVTIACTHHGAPALAKWLGKVVGLPVHLSSLHAPAATVTDADRVLPEADAIRYIAAATLALRAPSPVPPGAPAPDLLAEERRRHNVERGINRRFRVALAGAGFFLACGLITAVMGTITARQAAEGLDKSRRKLEVVKAEEKRRTEEARQASERLELLAKEGVPAAATLQSIASSLPPNVGLTQVVMNSKLTDVAGEALSERSIIALGSDLRRDPRFHDVTLASFEQVSPDKPEAGMRFRLHLIPPGASKTAPGAPSAGGQS